MFVAPLRALGSFRGESSLAAFIHRIAVRVAIKQRQRATRHRELLGEPQAPVAVDAIEARQEQQRLQAAIDQLSLEHQTVLALFAVDGLSHRESTQSKICDAIVAVVLASYFS